MAVRPDEVIKYSGNSKSDLRASNRAANYFARRVDSSMRQRYYNKKT